MGGCAVGGAGSQGTVSQACPAVAVVSVAQDPRSAPGGGPAQESFLRLAEQRHKEPIEHVDAYLYRTAHNLTIDHYRQERRRRTETRPNDDLAGFVADQPGPEESAVDADALARLREIVAELPPRTREIFRLNRLEGLTHAEVARRLEISDSSVQKHLARALAHVMQALEDSR